KTLDDQRNKARPKLEVSIYRQPRDVTGIVGCCHASFRTQVTRRHVSDSSALITRALRVPQQLSNGVVERDQAPFHARIVSINTEGVIMEERGGSPDTDQSCRTEVTRAALDSTIIVFVIGTKGIELHRSGVR